MKFPRFSLASIGFAILVLAIDFALIRIILFTGSQESWPMLAVFLMPLINVLLVASYRLRKKDRRTTRAIAFFITGNVAPVLVYAL